MPNASGSAKKQKSQDTTNSNSNTTTTSSLLQKSSNEQRNNNSNAGSVERTNAGSSSSSASKARKRKRCEVARISESDLESELEDCNLEDAMAIERKLRKVAETNQLSHEEMRRLLQKFVKNDHVLALVTLKAEDELARERREADQRAIIITDTPSVPKLTRAKARELNKTPAMSLPALPKTPPADSAAVLIEEDLHSDEEDEEYTFKDEDFASDDDPNTTSSDMDSNPKTPCTNTDYEDSPVKLTSDGCFKIPLEKRNAAEEDLRIATRTRSKLCLEQTTIEDIQSEFVPPDVEHIDNHEVDATANDEDWMEFLNDFTKPLNNTLLDDDDPINDPEYVAADKEPVDAEELRNVNISKKELTDLVAELFEGLINEGVSVESIDLETPQKFLASRSQDDGTDTEVLTSSNDKVLRTPTHAIRTNQSLKSDMLATVTRQPNFDLSSSSSINQNYSFQPDVMSTPSQILYTPNDNIAIPSMAMPENAATVTLPTSALAAEVLPLQNVMNSQDNINTINNTQMHMDTESYTALHAPKIKKDDDRYTKPFDGNYTWEYISIKRHILSEYMTIFENLKNIPIDPLPAVDHSSQSENVNGFTEYQSYLLQQQLRIHVQMLTQTYLQTYCHPEFWKMAPKPKAMIEELHESSKTHAAFRVYNLNEAVDLMKNWEIELVEDNDENKELIRFMNSEIEATYRSTRQILRLPPRIMDRMLNSAVFMYPEYLPRTAFFSKLSRYDVFSPSEMQLIAMGLEKHILQMEKNRERIPKNQIPWKIACRRLCKDTVHGKSEHRLRLHIEASLKTDYYNPIKYFFDRNRAPPVVHTIKGFENNVVLPPIDRFNELPLVYQKYLTQQNNNKERNKRGRKQVSARSEPTSVNAATPKRRIAASSDANASYLEFVRNIVDESIILPENLIEPAQPSENAASPSSSNCCNDQQATSTAAAAAAGVSDKNVVSTPEIIQRAIDEQQSEKRRRPKPRKLTPPPPVTINVNYVFGGNILNNTTTTTTSVNTLSSGVIDPQQHSIQSRPASALSSTLRSVEFGLGTSNSNSDISQQTALRGEEFRRLQNESSSSSKSSSVAIVGYNYNCNSKSVEPITEIAAKSLEKSLEPESTNYDSDDCFIVEEEQLTETPKPERSKKIKTPNRYRRINSYSDRFKIRWSYNFRRKKPQSAANRKRLAEKETPKHAPPSLDVRQRCSRLFHTYQEYLRKDVNRFTHSPSIKFIYTRVWALELYTNFLTDLKMFCKNASQTTTSTTTSAQTQAQTSKGIYVPAMNCKISNNPSVPVFPLTSSNISGVVSHSNAPHTSSSLGKRSRSVANTNNSINTNCDDETATSNAAATRFNKKLHRQEESMRHMLLPETPEDSNRKDAVFAYNFYEKVEETFKASNRFEDWKTFNNILKSFDPKCDRVSDLYYKLENLFLPGNPELAQTFLSFLLPAEAAEIGKFFEYFMITNVTTFVNKLNIYFSKQPAQIRKIYNCLNELAEDPNVTMKQIELRILPLLKGNQFLIDWFTAQFPEQPPPERLLPPAEYVNLKEVQDNQTGEFMETMNNIMDFPMDSSQNQQTPPCQLKYVNGRIFYGSKIMLPAKLSFAAKSFCGSSLSENESLSNGTRRNKPSDCLHGVREYGEKRIADAINSITTASSAAATATATVAAASVSQSSAQDNMSDEIERSEEDDPSAVLVIDTGEEDSCSSIELCDDTALRAHAKRLNPGYYGNPNGFSSATTSTPNANSLHHSTHHHYSNARKSALNFTEDGKTLSPRKNSNQNSSGSGVSILPTTPTSGTMLPNVNGTTNKDQRDRRRSPTKKIKSPNNATSNNNNNNNNNMSTTARNSSGSQCKQSIPPMVVIHVPQTRSTTSTSTAISLAKRLRTLTENATEENSNNSHATAIPNNAPPCLNDNQYCGNGKLNAPIIARPKERSPDTSCCTSNTNNNNNNVNLNVNLVPKLENSSDAEFLSENANLSEISFPVLKLDCDSPIDEDNSNRQRLTRQQLKEQREAVATATATATTTTPTTMVTMSTKNGSFTSDEDCKLDVVATLANDEQQITEVTKATTTAITSADAENSTITTTRTSQNSLAWTRDEDKIILVEMKRGSRDRNELYQRILHELPKRTLNEITARHQFLVDFLAKLQGK